MAEFGAQRAEQQATLWPVSDPAPWPRSLAIFLTLGVLLTPAAFGTVMALIAGTYVPIMSAAAFSVPWAWATPKLVGFMLTGIDDWEYPHHRWPKKRSR
jgi:hypothetical protein